MALVRNPVTGLMEEQAPAAQGLTDGQAAGNALSVQNQAQVPAGGNVALNNNLPAPGTVPNPGDIQQGQLNVGGAAQNVALAGASPVTNQLTTGLTNQFLQTPNFDQQAFQKNQLAGFDTNTAQAFEKSRRAGAGISNAGVEQRRLGQLALEQGQKRSLFEGDLQIQGQQEAERQFLSKIGAGQKGVESQLSGLQTATDVADPGLNRDFTASENALGRGQELLVQANDQEGNLALTELQGKISSGQLLSAQDWESSEAALDRILTKTIQDGDIKGQIEILGVQDEFNTMRDEANRTFANGERISQNAWLSDERISAEDAATASQVLDQKFLKAEADDDRAAMERIERDRSNLALKMQTNDFSFQEKKIWLDAEIADAFANGDVVRQKELLTFDAGIQFEEDMRNFGFETALNTQRGEITAMLEAGQFENARLLQNELLTHTVSEAALDRSMQQVGLDLEARGIDLQEEFQTFNQLMDSVDAGLISPDAAFEFVQSLITDTGIQIQTADPDAVLNAIQNQDELDRQQFILTHPEFVEEGFTGFEPGTGNAQFGTLLTPEGEQAYNDFINGAIYGEEEDEDGGTWLDRFLDGLDSGSAGTIPTADEQSARSVRGQ